MRLALENGPALLGAPRAVTGLEPQGLARKNEFALATAWASTGAQGDPLSRL
jgi:hypothetical protein